MAWQSEIVERNAVITDAEIRNDDHGILSAWVYLDFGGSGQGFGGFVLYMPEDFKHAAEARHVNYCGHFIWRVMEVAGVERWSHLKGKTVRARQEHSKVHALGHIVKDDWFYPDEDFKKLEAQPVSEKGQ